MIFLPLHSHTQGENKQPLLTIYYNMFDTVGIESRPNMQMWHWVATSDMLL